MKYYYRLDVCYAAELRSRAKDNAIAKVVGTEIGGSGCGFGERVLEFYFTSKARVKAAGQRVLKAPLGIVTVSYQQFEEQS